MTITVTVERINVYTTWDAQSENPAQIVWVEEYTTPNYKDSEGRLIARTRKAIVAAGKSRTELDSAFWGWAALRNSFGY